MEKIYKFKGKGLFIMAGIACIFTFIGAPISLIFFYMAAKAHIKITPEHFSYKMLRTHKIPFQSITKIQLAKPVDSRYHMGSGVFVNFATVVPLIIEHSHGKKVKLSCNFFENSDEIVRTLMDKTGLDIEMAN